MTRFTVRPLIALAALGWVVIGGHGLWTIVVEESSGDDWEIRYLVSSIALFVASLLTLVVLWRATSDGARSPMRVVGLAVTSLGVLSTVVAWALPLWMTLLAVGYGLLFVSMGQSRLRPVVLLAGAQLLGMAFLFAGMAAEVGRVDEYGDYPAAFGIGLAVTAVATIVSLYLLDRSLDADATPALQRPARLEPLG
jgi:hypothetical protein